MISKIVGSIARRSLTAIMAVALSSAILGTSAQAGPIFGSTGFTQQNNEAIGTLPNGSTVSNATSLTNVTFATNAMASYDFLAVPSNTDVGTAYTVPVHTGSSTFAFGDSAFGMFTATSEQIIFQGFGFANLTFTGTFTPGTDFPGKTEAAATFDVTFTQNGSTITQASSLSTVPEPSSMVLFGIGMSGFLAYRRLRKKQAVVA